MYLDGRKLTEGLLNHIEVAVRAFDPCLSCATHAMGIRPSFLGKHTLFRGPLGAVMRWMGESEGSSVLPVSTEEPSSTTSEPASA